MQGSEVVCFELELAHDFLWRNSEELNALIGELTPEEKEAPEIRHALNVSTAISTYNYHSLFQLYVEAPKMSAYIMDFFVPRARALALIVMCKA